MAHVEFKQHRLSGQFVDEPMERSFQRHNWRDTFWTQHSAAGCLHAVSMFLCLGGWRSSGAIQFIAINYALIFYSNWYLRSVIHFADANTKLTKFQKCCVSYVDSGCTTLHWSFVLVFHVWYNASEWLTCGLGSGADCAHPFDMCTAALPLLHAFLSSMIISLVDGRFWVAAVAILAINAPWMSAFWSYLGSSANQTPNFDSHLLRTIISLLCMMVVVSVHSWSTLLARRKWWLSPLLSCPTAVC
jgi:hypothetical protein